MSSKKIWLLLSNVSHFLRNVYLHLHGEGFIDTIIENSFISRTMNISQKKFYLFLKTSNSYLCKRKLNYANQKNLYIL